MVLIVHDKIYQSMPTLKEYILTLRAYNPGISDKTITVYLLKLGKKIEDIEMAFQEVSGKQATESAVESVATSAVGSTEPSVQVTDLEVMPEELSSGQPVPIQANQIKESSPVRPKGEQEIHHQSFENLVRLQDMIKDLDMNSSDSVDQPVVPSASAGLPADMDIASSDISVPKTQSSIYSGSSIQRKKFSYEELFSDTGPQNIPSASSPKINTGTNLEVEMAPAGMPKKDPTVSYVGGSIVAGEGSGAFAFKSSPVISPQVQSDTLINTNNTIDIKAQIQTVPKGKSIIKKLVLTILILAILLGGIFGYTRYVHGVYLFVKAPYASELFIEQFAKHLMLIQTAEYELGIHVAAMEAGSEDEVFRISTSNNQSDSVPDEAMDPSQSINTASSTVSGDDMNSDTSDNFMAGNLLPMGSKVTLGLKGMYQKDASSRDNILSFKGSYIDNGMTLDLDVETITNDGVLYIRINSAPTFFFDISKIKGKWISISPADIETVFGDVASVPEFSSSQKQSLVKVLQYFAQSGAFTVGADPEKTITQDRKVQYTYKITVDTERLIGFIQNLPQLLRTELGEEGESYARIIEGVGKNISSPEAKRYMEYLNRHSNLSVTVDSKGKLVGITSQSDIVIVNESASNSVGIPQKTSTTIELKTNKINSNVKVESPAQVDMTFLDIYSLLTGKSKEDILFFNQVNRVQSLDRTIMNDLRAKGRVPADISEIKQVYSGSLKDIFANPAGDFVYTTSSSTEYQLVYNIKLPAVPTDYYDVLYSLTVGPEAVGQNKYDSGISINAKKPVLTLRFVEGKNTATQSTLSKEAMVTMSMDADKDGLSDVLEAYLGLNSAKADTDTDGKTDIVELRQGTNPKGAGGWTAGYSGQ